MCISLKPEVVAELLAHEATGRPLSNEVSNKIIYLSSTQSYYSDFMQIIDPVLPRGGTSAAASSSGTAALQMLQSS